MGVHPAIASAPSTHGPTASQRSPGDWGHPLHPHHWLPLAGLTPRVWRAHDGVATTQALGRRRNLGAHLACRSGHPRPTGQAGLVERLSWRFLCPRQERRRESRFDQKGQGDQVDDGRW